MEQTCSCSYFVRARLSAGQDGRVVIKDGIGLFLAGCALAAFLLLRIAMPETRKAASDDGRRASPVEPGKQNKTTAPAG
jgi:hypothetical protein